MGVIVPFGALPGFSLSADIRELAAHYGVREAQLREDGRGGQNAAQARHALFWKLVTVRSLAPTRVAQLLRCSAKTVREGVAKHEHRIREFRDTAGIKGAREG